MEKLTMSIKESKQFVIIDRILRGELSLKLGAQALSLSVRWLREKIKRYKEFGAAGLVHRNRNRRSKRQTNPEYKELICKLMQGEWHDFSPTFTARKLWEMYRIKISAETVRKIMIEQGFWRARRKKVKHRKKRDRQPAVGLMTQLDGSNHDWFEGRGPRCTLLVFIDDATSQLLRLEFASSESYNAVTQATKNDLSEHGLPRLFYVDHGSVFSVNLNNKERDKLTQWERGIRELGGKVIHANSPQAKGRVERANKTLQDHLVKEMRLANINSIEAANEFLCRSDYIERHNQSFSVKPLKEGNAHTPVTKEQLDFALCQKHERIVTNDFTIQYQSRVLQLTKRQPAIVKPKDKITVQHHLDGSLLIHNQGSTQLQFKEIAAMPQKRLNPVDYVNQENHRKELQESLPSVQKYPNKKSIVPLKDTPVSHLENRN